MGETHTSQRCLAAAVEAACHARDGCLSEVHSRSVVPQSPRRRFASFSQRAGAAPSFQRTERAIQALPASRNDACLTQSYTAAQQMSTAPRPRGRATPPWSSTSQVREGHPAMQICRISNDISRTAAQTSTRRAVAMRTAEQQVLAYEAQSLPHARRTDG